MHNVYKDKFAGVTPAWHKLGKPIPEGADALTAMRAAGQTDWDVKAIPLRMNVLVDSGTGLAAAPIDNMGLHVIIRKDNDTGNFQIASDQLVFDDYLPISNEDVFGPMVELLTGEGLPVDAAGVLGRLGNRAFMTFNAGHIEVGGGEAYLKYLVALAAHTGRHAIRLLPTAIRVVCENTEQAALRAARMMLSIEHSRVALDRFYEDPDSARRVLNLSHHYDKNLALMAADLQSLEFEDADWENVIEHLLEGKPEPDTARKRTNRIRFEYGLHEAWGIETKRAADLGQPATTLWTGKQAASTFVQHISRGGGVQRAGRSMRMALGEPVPMLSDLNNALMAATMNRYGATKSEPAVNWLALA